MTDFILNNTSNTPPLYQFKLENPDTQEYIILKTEPLEWKSGVIEIDRDINKGGIFTSFSVDSLTFIKEGADFIRKIWNEKEMNGRCTLIVSWFKFATQSYVEMPSQFALNFATLKPRVKIKNIGIGVKAETVKEDILVKLENRKGVKVDITKKNTVGGATIKDYKNFPYTDLKKYLNFDEVNTKFQTQWIGDYDPPKIIENNKSTDIYTQLEMKFSANEYNEAKETEHITGLTNISQVKKFFQSSEEQRDIEFFYYVDIIVTNRKGGFLNARNVYWLYVDVVNADNSVASNTLLGRAGDKKETVQIFGTLNISLNAGQSMRFYIRTDDTDGIDAYVGYLSCRVTQNVVNYSAKRREGFPIYEATERVLQLILDQQFPFYSEYFGRTDTPYLADGTCYPTENQKRFAHIFSGLNLRGAYLFDPNNPLSISFDELFNAENCLYNIGYEVEYIGANKRIRIENYDYFFNNVEVINLSSRIGRYDIETESMPELGFSKFISGYEDFEYEAISGRGEFNTNNERTAVLNTDATYDNKSKLRADTKGITVKLLDELDTEDTKEDNSLFIVKSQRFGDEWNAEREENIQVLEDSSLFGEDTFNLYYTPTRILLRHANRIKGAYLKYLNTYLRFQAAGKLQTLKTEGEGVTVVENEDLLIDSLDAPIYKPIKHTVTCKFTFSDLETLMTNPKGFITFSSTVKGYLLNLTRKNGEDKATISIIEKV